MLSDVRRVEGHNAVKLLEKTKAFIIGASQLVTHASTGPTGDCLASEVGRAQAGPITYERRRVDWIQIIYNHHSKMIMMAWFDEGVSIDIR